MLTEPSDRDLRLEMDPASTVTAPQHALCIANHSRSNNLGPLLRSCAAFASAEIVLVGYDEFSSQGSHGSHKVRSILLSVSLAALHTHHQLMPYCAASEVHSSVELE